MLNAPKSKEGCSRQFWAVIRLYRRDFAGGGSFGYDWNTFAINSPSLYNRAKALQSAYVSLPSRKD